MTNNKIITSFDPQIVESALTYYGLPLDYKRFFQPKYWPQTGGTGLIAINQLAQPDISKPLWVQVNQPPKDFPTWKKPSITDIEIVSNIILDFEFPSCPGLAHNVGQDLIAFLVQEGLTENKPLSLEDSGAGCHLLIPIQPIKLDGNAVQINAAINMVVQEYIKPEFERLIGTTPMKLEAYNIDRLLAAPGTWRPGGSKPDEIYYLKGGYMRQWLVQEERYESAALTSLITSLAKPAKTKNINISDSSTSTSSIQTANPNAANWIKEYATTKLEKTEDESRNFYRLVGATRLRFDEATAIFHAALINELSGTHYTGRERQEVERAIKNGAGNLTKVDYKTYKKDTAKNTTTPPTPPDDRILADMNKFSPFDDGNAQAVLYLYKEQIRWLDATGWLVYDDKTGSWTGENASHKVHNRVVEGLIRRRVAGVKAQCEPVVNISKPNSGKVKACLDMIKPKVAGSLQDFDRNPDVLNCQNGVIDLRTGDLLSHSPNSKFLHCVKTDYVPEARSEAFENWLTEVVGGGEEIIKYLQLLAGYSLTGRTNEELMIYLYGPTRSGKSTFCDLLVNALLGTPLGKPVAYSSFAAKRDPDASNFDLADLRPCRLIWVGETDKNQGLNAALLKTATGGDPIRASKKYGAHFEFIPRFKLWMCSNWEVNADPDDSALWGRVRLVVFPNSYLGREDTGLKSRFRQLGHLQGILAWVVRGAQRWYQLQDYKLKIQTPEIVEKWKRDQRLQIDFVQQWIEQSCERESDYWTSNKDLSESYNKFCSEIGIEPKKMRNLAQTLKLKGFQVGQVQRTGISNTARGVQGLRILP